MDPDVIRKHQDDLPNLNKLIKSERSYDINSTFPPDSIPAWVTIFTGVHPAEHGWLDNIDYEDIKREGTAYDIKKIEGNAFWDVAGRMGKRVCVINPFLAYPVWPVNGVMANGPVFITGDVQAFPNNIIQDYHLPQLGGMTDFPTEKNLSEFINSSKQTTEDLARFGIELLKKEEWDLFFISFFTLDRLQHFLWRFYDESDPTHEKNNQYKNVIPNFYKLFDSIIGKFVDEVGKDASLMVISDHGHGLRPLNLFNINEFLRIKGLLKIKEDQKITKGKVIIEKFKNSFLYWLSEKRLENVGYTLAKLITKGPRKQLKKSAYLIDFNSSDLWLSEIGGGSSFGGLQINLKKYSRGSESYKDLVNKTIKSLYDFSGTSDIPIIKWIKPVSEFDSRVQGFYPDILFELDERYSFGRSLFLDLISKNPRHMRISGGHKPRGVLFLKNINKAKSINPGSVMDVFNMIIDIISD
jgi:predicted AlkP superfamily phosphohydrolase/phosphomutase